MLTVIHNVEEWEREFAAHFPTTANEETPAMITDLAATFRNEVMRELVDTPYKITHRQSVGVGALIQRGTKSERAAFNAAVEQVVGHWRKNEWA